MEILRWLQEWYASQCDGDWEHGSNIRITTIDNPGWGVRINLIDTELENKKFNIIQVDRTEDDWVYCNTENGCFIGAGGTGNLEEILMVFYRWATNN
ncbi:immunity 53 family protein [Brevibacillus brevis]|uniref:immunity 53 family protein n=1 Tax=Brevibacillus brevis TaxID=1393 RepID=UPI000B396393|nr:immunity 53 family protein [Brevibacillus brevis]OUQ86848.1 rhodanese-related sulfurtransferase [Brevibacillus brevis]WGV61853.1 immunity 53 family protein [Brevibacillus brevis]